MKPLATFRLISPSRSGEGSGAAIALIELTGDIDAACERMRIKPVRIGTAALRDFAGVDEGVLMRVSEDTAVLTPHGGAAVVRQLREAMRAAGLREDDGLLVRAGAMDTIGDVTRAMLQVLAGAASPAAVDVLLDQPRRWKQFLNEVGAMRVRDVPADQLSQRLTPYGARLRRLIEPATVAAWGPANIGKSTLLNALAKRSVSMVADVPGTTRDHVGVLLDLGGDEAGGIVVKYVDTPGIEEAETIDADVRATINREAQRLAREVVAKADLVLLCADVHGEFLRPPGTDSHGDEDRVIRVRLRADLVGKPVRLRDDMDVVISAMTGQGLRELTALIRERLVGAAALADNRPWCFWE